MEKRGQEQDDASRPLPALPTSAPLEAGQGGAGVGAGGGGGSGGGKREEEVQTITVDGFGIKLDHLGPIIVNTDGTLTRIANWGALTEQERQVALRRIAKRNRARREQLASAAQEKGGEEEEGET